MFVVFYKKTMVGIEAVQINQCSILPQLVTNLLYITVQYVSLQSLSRVIFSLTHGAQTGSQSLLHVYSITYNTHE